ncbi:hypothetical protein BCY86_01775 [Pajaroellobacter abortibovis]|uniref:Thioredoxin-like fold domain-containing protein n=1 Tax=Pajaroellobacter abortibovis TaxID=1882918 RepID=A0A1L6MVN6_9BACT|nr:hypothetical protein BCY86_01775 [Pajaroellobacter abortibovis]
MNLPFPIAVAPPSSEELKAFGYIEEVPCMIIFDEAGQIVACHPGLIKSDELRSWLRTYMQ